MLTYRSDRGRAGGVVDEIWRLGARAAALRLDLAAVSALDGFLDEVRGALREWFGGGQRIDSLVNDAGIGQALPIDQVTEADFDTLSAVHLKGVAFLTQKALRMMNDGGSVVFITAAADRHDVPSSAIYAAMKGAVEVFSRYVAKGYGPRGIRSNTVAPGGVMTDFANGAIRNSPALQEMLVAQTPMGRLAEPRDIGGLVALLCGDGARWLTGQRLEATGGFRL